MKLSTKPDTYSPGINDDGIYIDVMPSFNFNDTGYYCPCCSRKDKVYETKGKLKMHSKTKNHQLWLKNINLNKLNYYKKYEETKEIIKSQKIMIGALQKKIDTKSLTIDYLTIELKNKLEINPNVKIDDLINL
jgi:hypothetical protein|tara:strand:+ start:8090 stop:8488 length:399 start_codon:yes stop_codon:yes gene_type:complete